MIGRKVTYLYNKSYILIFTISLMLVSNIIAGNKDIKKIENWFILLDYNSNVYSLSQKQINKFDLAILDADAHPRFDKNSKTMMIGYVSLGEAESYRYFWPKIKDTPIILQKNPNWLESCYVDINNPEWSRLLLEEVIPNIVSQGFDGLFFDTIDTVDIFADNKQEYENAKTAMITLIKNIREKYPDLYLISNNGFSIIYDIVEYLNGVLIEDLSMMIDFKTNKYRKVEEDVKQDKTKVLRDLKQKYDLDIFVIDYADENDKKSKKICKNYAEKNGFLFYVAEKNLSKIYKQ